MPALWPLPWKPSNSSDLCDDGSVEWLILLAILRWDHAKSNEELTQEVHWWVNQPSHRSCFFYSGELFCSMPCSRLSELLMTCFEWNLTLPVGGGMARRRGVWRWAAIGHLDFRFSTVTLSNMDSPCPPRRKQNRLQIFSPFNCAPLLQYFFNRFFVYYFFDFLVRAMTSGSI
jgi:hypothetical protein